MNAVQLGGEKLRHLQVHIQNLVTALLSGEPVLGLRTVKELAGHSTLTRSEARFLTKSSNTILARLST